MSDESLIEGCGLSGLHHLCLLLLHVFPLFLSLFVLPLLLNQHARFLLRPFRVVLQ